MATKKNTVTVSVTLKLEVPIEQWATTYGTEATASAVRADVKQYVVGCAAGSAGAEEAGMRVLSDN